jgi:recombinational DNA repair ATPase RecF
MKVVKLIAENVKKLRAVEITPDGAVVAITGKNDAGKSSVLDSLWWALAGTKHIQAVPIRKGASKARIKLDLGELVVERRFGKSGSQLTVTSADGAKYASPQGMLDALLGALTFDPLAFVKHPAPMQLEQLKVISGLDFEQEELQNNLDYVERSEINREAKRLRAAARSIEIAEDTAVPVAVDTSEIKDAMAAAAEVNAGIERDAAKIREANAEIEMAKKATERYEQEVEKQERLLAEAQERAGEARVAETDLKRAFEGLPSPAKPINVDTLREKLDSAEASNELLHQMETKQDYIRRAKIEEEKSDKLTSAMQQREDDKAEAIATAKMPVKGLGFGDGYVTLNSIPFDQASTSEQLRVSVAIAMAANPKLRVLRIKDGSTLDAENMAALGEMAAENDYQIWIEKVDESGKVGVVIEDGTVVTVNPS